MLLPAFKKERVGFGRKSTVFFFFGETGVARLGVRRWVPREKTK